MGQLVVGDNKLHIDLKNGNGAVKWGEDKADVTITMSDADFVAMAEGKLDGMQAFMGGKLKIKGNMMLAQKLQGLIEAAKKSRRTMALARRVMLRIVLWSELGSRA